MPPTMPHTKDLVRRAKTEVFKNKEEVEVIAAVEVQQCALTAALLYKLNGNKKSARQALGELRVVIISGEWDTNSSTIKLGLYPCSVNAGRLQVKRGYALAGLKKVTAVINDGLAPLFAIGMTFGSTNRETDLTFQAKNEETLFRLLCPLWHFLQKVRQPGSRGPELVGLPERRGDILNHITDWNARYLDQSIERRLTARQYGGNENSEQPAENPSEPEEEVEDKSDSVISAQQMKDLSQVINRYEYEVRNIGDVEATLQQELASLQASSVQTILDSTLQVSKVRDSLNDALALLDDVNENLETFDTKLQVMREDIAEIENRNNRLELQTRNNGKLLEALDRLLDKMQLSSDTERKLRHMSFASRNREAMIEAGWELYDHLHSLGESVKDSKDMSGFGNYGIANMSAVSDQRARFSSITNTYVEHAAEYIGVELTNQTTHHLQMATAGGDSKLRVPDHSQLHRDIEDLTSIVHVARTARPNIIKKISLQYTDAFNALLRKELRQYTSEMRKSVLASIQNLQTDIDLLKGNYKSKEEVVPVESFSERKSGLQHLMLGVTKGPDTPTKQRKQPELPFKVSVASKLSEAWAHLLQDWIPILLIELDQCAEFLNFKEHDMQLTQDLTHIHHENGEISEVDKQRKSAERSSLEVARNSSIGIAALEALMVDISTDFFTIADIAAKQQQLQAIPMLSTTLQWLTKIKGLPLASHIYLLLHQCAQRLLNSFTATITDMEKMLRKFESKFMLKDGLKHIHLLPFVESFPSIVAYFNELLGVAVAFKPSLKPNQSIDEIEEDIGTADILQDEDDFEAQEEEDFFVESGMADIEGARSRRTSLGSRTDAGRKVSFLKNGLQRPTVQLRTPQTSQLARASSLAGRSMSLARTIIEKPSVEGHDGRLRQLTEAELPDCIPDMRLVHSAKDAVDPAIAILAGAIFKAIEGISLRDPKHGERVKMENYLAFADLLRDFASSNAIVEYFVRDADNRSHEAIEDYIQQQMEYSKVWRLVEFSTGIDYMLLQVGNEEVTFQSGFTPADFGSTLATTLNSGLQRRLTVIKARIIKHMERDHELMQMVWQRFQEKLIDSYTSLHNVADGLYPSIKPPLTPEELRQIFDAVDGQGQNA